MAIEIWQKLVVDRVHLTIPLGSKKLHGLLVSILKGMVDLQAGHVPNGKLTITENYYRTRLDWYPAKKRKIADLEIGASKSGHGYFKVSLFPSQFRLTEFEYLKNVFLQFMPMPYELLHVNARVSYLELAADSLSHVAHSFIPFRPMCGYSSIYVDKEGVPGTTYLGSTASALRFRIYDKRRQQLQTGLTPPYSTHTRIEAVCRHTGLTVAELESKMVNPFRRLEIADLPTARKLKAEKPWQVLLDQCLAVGSAQALTAYPAKQRRQHVKLLRKAAAPWWNPHDSWKGLPNALMAIAP